MESSRDREVACSASDLKSLNFESCVWRAVSSHSSHHPQEVFLTQFSLYVHKSGINPDSFHFIYPSKHDVALKLVQLLRRWPNITPALGQRLVFSGTEGSAIYLPVGICKPMSNPREKSDCHIHLVLQIVGAHHPTILLCKGKRLYLLTLQVSRYCLLPLQSKIVW